MKTFVAAQTVKTMGHFRISVTFRWPAGYKITALPDSNNLGWSVGLKLLQMVWYCDVWDAEYGGGLKFFDIRGIKNRIW